MESAVSVNDAALETLVSNDQIELLFSKSAFTFWVSPINATLFAWVAWGELAHWALIAWIGAFTVVALARTGLRSAFRRRPRRGAEARRWARAFTVLTAFTGSIWGAGAFLGLATPNLAVQLLFMLIICGMSAGSATLSASHLPAYWAFVVPEIIPLTVRLLIGADRLHVVLMLLTFIFVGAMNLMARTTGRATREASRLGHALARLNQSLESRVAERTAELRAALTVRDEFISIASHELKTPLTSLKLQVQILERDLGKSGLRARVRSAARFPMLARQTSRLTALLTTLLDVSASTDRLPLEPREIDFAQIVRRVAGDLEEELRNTGSSLTLSLEEPLDGWWDPLRLEQIVANLLSNAVKYGQGRPISVTLAGDESSVRLTVADRGIGIAAADQARIFGKFERAAQTEGYGGFGLGLFVVQQLVDAMGGRIEVQSELGRGATFTVELSRSRLAATLHAPPSPV